MARLSDIGARMLLHVQPETAHRLAIAALKSGFVPAGEVPQDKRLNVRTAGLVLPNPLGIAAGFDKNAEVANALLKLGFGFAEVGTITPLPQAGNPQPRIFRLPGDLALINRLGFNNKGHAAALAELKARSRRAGIVGVNIGANKDSVDRIADYVEGVRVFASVADYFTVNISSPNTPGLRDLQDRESLAALLDAVTEARQAAANISGKRVPVFVKIAPDLDDEGLAAVAETVAAKAVDGVVMTNTTLSRVGLTDADLARETGGLSGRPLFRRSTAALARMRRALGIEMTLIAAGGVDSAETALTKIRAGADLVQLYTGFIYGGPRLPGQIVAGLLAIVERDGAESIAAYRDQSVEEWSQQPL